MRLIGGYMAVKSEEEAGALAAAANDVDGCGGGGGCSCGSGATAAAAAAGGGGGCAGTPKLARPVRGGESSDAAALESLAGAAVDLRRPDVPLAASSRERRRPSRPASARG